MKRIFWLPLSLALLFAFAIAACSGNKTTKKVDPAADYDHARCQELAEKGRNGMSASMTDEEVQEVYNQYQAVTAYMNNEIGKIKALDDDNAKSTQMIKLSHDNCSDDWIAMHELAKQLQERISAMYSSDEVSNLYTNGSQVEDDFYTLRDKYKINF